MAIKSQIKTLLLCVPGGVAIIALLFLTRPLYLSDDFLTRQIETRLSSALGLDVRIQSGRFHLRNSATLRGASLRNSSGREILIVDGMHLRYHLTPLLHRRVVVDELTVINPRVTVPLQNQPRDTTSGGSHPDSTLSADSQPDSSAASFDSFRLLPKFELPLSIEIEHLEIRNAALLLSQNSPTEPLQAELGGLNVNCRRLHFKTSDDLSAMISLEASDTLKLSINGYRHSVTSESALDLMAAIKVEPGSDSLDLSLAIEPVVQVPSSDSDLRTGRFPEIKLSVKSSLDDSGNLNVEEANLFIGQQVVLKVRAELQDIARKNQLTIAVEEGKLNLDSLWALWQKTSSLFDIKAVPDDLALSGRLHVLESSLVGTISAPKPNLRSKLNCSLEDVSFQDSKHNITLSNLDANVSVEGRAVPVDSLSFDLTVHAESESLELGARLENGFIFAPMSVNVSASGESGWKDIRGKIRWDASGPFGCQETGSLVLSMDRLNLDDPLRSQGIRLEGGASAEDLPIEAMFPEIASGLLSAAFDVKVNALDDAKVQFGALCPDFRLRVSKGDLHVPLLTLDVAAKGAISPALDRIEARKIRLDVLPYFSADFSGELKSLRDWKVEYDDLQINLAEISSFLNPLVPAHLQNAHIAGRAVLNGMVQGQIKASRPIIRHDGQLTLDSLALALPDFGLEMGSSRLWSSIEGDAGALNLEGGVRVGSLSIPSLRAQPYRDIEAAWDGGYTFDSKTAEGSLSVDLPELALHAISNSRLAFADTATWGNGDLSLRFASRDSIQILDGFNLKGDSRNHLAWDLSPDSTLHVDGILEGRSLSLNYGQVVRADDLDLLLPLDIAFDLDPRRVSRTTEFVRPLALEDPVIFTSFEHLFPPNGGHGTIRCQHLRVAEYEMSDLAGYLSYHAGELFAPRLTLKAYDGSVQGALRVNLPALHPDSLNYQIQLTGLGLNTARLPGARAKKGEDSEISAFARFQGQGVHPDGYFNLQGGLEITRIGRGVADNLLRFLDPNETDPSIQTYRRYIKRGWGVKVFSFNVKDDFVYAAITPAKPPFSKLDMFILSRFLGLGKSITFGRVPLKFFLTPSLAAE